MSCAICLLSLPAREFKKEGKKMVRKKRKNKTYDEQGPLGYYYAINQ